VKVKQKVSGQFKSTKKADGFATLRSIADTLIKQGKSVFEEILLLARINFVVDSSDIDAE